MDHLEYADYIYKQLDFLSDEDAVIAIDNGLKQLREKGYNENQVVEFVKCLLSYSRYINESQINAMTMANNMKAQEILFKIRLKRGLK